MREYIISLGCVMTISALAQMLMPEGSIKKFASLAMGFMIVATVLSPISFNIKDLTFKSESTEIDFSSAEATYRAEVIMRHKENLNEKINAQMVHGSKAFVETDNDGNITSVTIRARGDESKAVLYITNELKVSRERIKIINEDNQ